MSTSATATAPSAQAATENATQRDTVRQTDGELLQLVSFVVGNEEFAIPILSVQEINRMMQITRVPQSPPFIEGVINLRGKIIPVMDLRKRFGMKAGDAGNDNDNRIIVVEVASRVIGFTVDRVNEVLRIGSEIVEPPPSMVAGVESDYVEGVGKLDDRLLILLNLERLFSGADLQKVDQAVKTAK
ncbi:MAG: chemotaxis protein CheW [Phycisphaera sp.]|nr:chemotaxis protein CheW [Phycisphaera sp.]